MPSKHKYGDIQSIVLLILRAHSYASENSRNLTRVSVGQIAIAFCLDLDPHVTAFSQLHHTHHGESFTSPNAVETV